MVANHWPHCMAPLLGQQPCCCTDSAHLTHSSIQHHPACSYSGMCLSGVWIKAAGESFMPHALPLLPANLYSDLDTAPPPFSSSEEKQQLLDTASASRDKGLRGSLTQLDPVADAVTPAAQRCRQRPTAASSMYSTPAVQAFALVPPWIYRQTALSIYPGTRHTCHVQCCSGCRDIPPDQ